MRNLSLAKMALWAVLTVGSASTVVPQTPAPALPEPTSPPAISATKANPAPAGQPQAGSRFAVPVSRRTAASASPIVPPNSPRFIGPKAPTTRPVRLPPRQMSSPAPTTPPDALVFDATTKEVTTEPGQTKAAFTFHLTNTADVVVSINNVHTSCGCTVAKLPAQPWKMAPGESGPLDVTVDLRGKRGIVSKSVTVQSSSGVKSLMVKVNIPDARSGFVQTDNGGVLDMDRVQNIQKALVDRQLVFSDKSCAECHADKAAGKTGKELYEVACAICHDAPHRATMVTDFKQKHPGIADGWRQWIMYGKTNTLMPAFALSAGGILSDVQVESLVEYVTKTMPPVTQFSSAASVPDGVKPVVYVPPWMTSQPRALPVAHQAPSNIRPQAPAPAPTQARTPALIPKPPPQSATQSKRPAVPEPRATPIRSFPFPKDT